MFKKKGKQLIFRFFALSGRKLLLPFFCCLNLFAFSQQDSYQEFNNIYLNSNASVVNCSIQVSKQKTLYVGTYNGLCYLEPKSSTFKTIALPVRFKKNSLLVNSLLED